MKNRSHAPGACQQIAALVRGQRRQAARRGERYPEQSLIAGRDGGGDVLG